MQVLLDERFCQESAQLHFRVGFKKVDVLLLSHQLGYVPKIFCDGCFFFGFFCAVTFDKVASGNGEQAIQRRS